MPQTKKDWRKYYNKDKSYQWNQNYINNNKEKVLQKTKEYYEKNKEKISEKRKAKYNIKKLNKK